MFEFMLGRQRIPEKMIAGVIVTQKWTWILGVTQKLMKGHKDRCNTWCLYGICKQVNTILYLQMRVK